jgi:hypothetical protein
MRITDAFRLGFLEWTWEEIVPAGGPEPSGNRGGPLFARDGTGKFILVGGRTSGSVDRDDYWSFDFGGTNTWTQVVASGLTNVGIPSGYADGNGNILVGGNGGHVWDLPTASTSLSKIAVSGGAQTALTDSGTGALTGNPGHMTVDIPNKRIYTGRIGSFDYNVGVALTASVQNTAANTNTKTGYTTSSIGLVGASSLAYHPASNSLYTIVSNVAYSGGTWIINTDSIYKYDLTAGTGWAKVTGVVNNAGSVAMPAWPNNQNQLIWSAIENKFFLFVAGTNFSCGRVLTFDPATKTIAEALFTGLSPAYILGEFDGYSAPRGNCGTVVESNGAFYFCASAANASITNARIWRFRRS